MVDFSGSNSTSTSVTCAVSLTTNVKSAADPIFQRHKYIKLGKLSGTFVFIPAVFCFCNILVLLHGVAFLIILKCYHYICFPID